MAYIAALNRNDNGEFLRKLAAKIDDKSPERWMSRQALLSELKKRAAELRSGKVSGLTTEQAYGFSL